MPVKPFVTLAIIAFLFSFSPTAQSEDQRLPHLFRQMYDSIKNVKTVRQNVSALERTENKYLLTNSEIKIQNLPRKIYFNNPTKKLEILYNAELYTNKAWVKPHVFPYMTLLLDPHGNLMRKNQHYTIFELGYDFIGKAIALTISKDKEGFKNFSYRGKATKNNTSCHLIEYENKSYGFVDYVVGEKETATMISLKLCVNDYLLRDKNDLFNDFGFLKKGTVLKVPNLYCQKAVLYIDEKLMLPSAINLFDNKGLFESYEFTNIRINSPIKAEEFLKEYSEYNF